MTTTGNVCAHPDRTDEILSAVARRIGTQKFDAWFKTATKVSCQDDQVKVGAANPFVAGWIESHFADDLSEAVREVTGAPGQVQVSVDPALAGKSPRGQLDRQAMLVAKATDGTARRPVAAPASGKRLRHRLECFVSGPSNQLAYSAAMAVTTGQAVQFNPLFIHGCCGVGKTHLLQGICNGVDAHKINWKYLTAEEFTNHFVEAIRHRKLEEFRRVYRHLDLLVIDDVHFLASKKATQEEFLHTFNTIEAAGRQVVMASDTHPRMLGRLTEQLVSRFLSGMVVKIDAPDGQTRLRILQQAAARARLSIDAQVLEYVAMHVRGSARELEGTLVKLTALAELNGQPVSLAIARDALADHLSHTDSAVTLGDIESVVTGFFGITPADIHSTRRTHTVSLARTVAMFLARRHTRMSFPEIGGFMGKNHSSAILAVQRMEKALVGGDACRWLSAAGPKTMPAKGLVEMLEEQLS
jgi:chromosomal replication initiator protein